MRSITIKQSEHKHIVYFHDEFGVAHGRTTYEIQSPVLFSEDVQRWLSNAVLPNQ